MQRHDPCSGRWTQRPSDAADNLFVGGPIKLTDLRFAGLRNAPLGALRDQRAAWGPSAATDGAGHAPEDRFLPDPAEPAAGAAVRAWVERLRLVRAQEATPPGPELPRHDSGRGELAVLADGSVCREQTGMLQRTYRCAPPYTDWDDVGEATIGSFRPGGTEQIFAAGRAGVISWDPKTWQQTAFFPDVWEKLRQEMGASVPKVRQVLCHPDGESVVAQVEHERGGSLLVGNLRTGEAVLHRGLGASPSGKLEIHPTGRWLVAWDQRGEILVRPWGENTWPRSLREATEGKVRGVAMHPSEDRMALLWHDGSVSVLEMAPDAGRGYGFDLKGVADIAFSPFDGALVALMPSGERVRLSRGDDTGQPVGAATPAPVAGEASGIAFHPGGEWYVTSHQDGVVRVWDAETHAPWFP